MTASPRPQGPARVVKGSPSTTPLLQAPYPWAKNLPCGHVHPKPCRAPGAASRPPSLLACLLWATLLSCELWKEAGQQGSPLLLLSPDQRCLLASGWSTVQPGLCSWQSQQMPGSCRGVGVGFRDPLWCWVLPQIHPGRAIRVTPPFCCSENPKSGSFSSWVMLQGVSLLRAAAPGIHGGSPAPSAGLGELSLPSPGSQGGRRQLRQVVFMGLISIWIQQAGEVSNQHFAKMAKPNPTVMGEQRGQRDAVPLETA